MGPDLPKPATLQYAGVLLPRQVEGVTIENPQPGVRRVFIPPVSEWKTFSGLSLVGIGYAAVMLAEIMATPLATHGFTWFLGLVYLTFIAGVVWFLISSRQIAFEIDRYSLRLSRAGPLGLRQSHWSRSDVLDVHQHRFNGRLVVRWRGHDPVEIYVASEREQAARIVDEVNAALGAITAAVPSAKFPPPDRDAGVASSRARSLLFSMSIVMTLASFAALVFRPYGGIFCLCGLILAAIPVGIGAGTQRKSWI